MTRIKWINGIHWIKRVVLTRWIVNAAKQHKSVIILLNRIIRVLKK